MALPHPEAVAALQSPGSGITGHFSSPPFQGQQLKNPQIKRLLSSYEVLGGPATGIVLWSGARFRDEQLEAYAALLGALDEAVPLIAADRKAAIEAYIRVEGSKSAPALLDRIPATPRSRSRPRRSRPTATPRSSTGSVAPSLGGPGHPAKRAAGHATDRTRRGDADRGGARGDAALPHRRRHGHSAPGGRPRGGAGRPSGPDRAVRLRQVEPLARDHRLRPPDEGEIVLRGAPVCGPGPDRVVVFQEFDQLLPWRTVRRNITFPLRAARGLGARWPIAGWRRWA